MLPPMEWIERVIRIDSITHHGNAEIVRFLIPLLKQSGLKVQEQKIIERNQRFTNLIAFNETVDSPDLLVLNTHLDTVSAGNTRDWTKTGGDPFQATRVGDRVYGLGSADVKIDFLCKLMAIRHASPWVRPFALVGTYGEERGLIGASELLKAQRVKPKFALIGEPSNLELIYAHKGHLIYVVGIPLGRRRAEKKSLVKEWKGKAAHSSTPLLGENAITHALQDILKRGYGIASLEGGTDSNRIPDHCQALLSETGSEGTARVLEFHRLLLDIGRDLRRRKDSRFSPSTATLSLNQVSTIKDEIRFTFDVRLLPETDTKMLKKKLGQAIATVSGRILSVTHDAALRGTKDGALMRQAAKALKECKLPVIRKTKASCTEAALYNESGAEAIVFGPGISVGNVHRPNEHNSLRQMSAATRFYHAMLSMGPREF